MSLVLLCPGQGGQHPDMFKRVRANAQAQPVLDLASTLLGAPVAQMAADASRFHNAVAQPLVCAAALAHWAASWPRTRWRAASTRPPVWRCRASAPG